jgi:hypothetical protein
MVEHFSVAAAPSSMLPNVANFKAEKNLVLGTGASLSLSKNKALCEVSLKKIFFRQFVVTVRLLQIPFATRFHKALDPLQYSSHQMLSKTINSSV